LAFCREFAVVHFTVTEASETLKDIERDIAAIKALIARIKAQVESGQLTDPELAEAANNSYIAAKQDLQRLEQRKGETTQIANEDRERQRSKCMSKGEQTRERILARSAQLFKRSGAYEACC
jgi:hypothetical protein